MATKKLVSLFLTSILAFQSSLVLAVPPHAEPLSAEEQRILNTVNEELRKPAARPSAPSSWWDSWFGSWFGGKKDTAETGSSPFKDYFDFFYFINMSLDRICSLGPDPIRSELLYATWRSARSQLYSMLHATRLPEELDARKFKEYSDQIAGIKELYALSLTAVCSPYADVTTSEARMQIKIHLLDEVKSFLGKFSTHLSAEKIGFIELADNEDAEIRYRSLSIANAPRLAQLYFNRVDRANIARVLIVGNGRAVPYKGFMDSLIINPSSRYPKIPCIRYGYEYIYNLGRSVDEEYYQDSKYDYFLVDIDPSVRPDVCLDITKPSEVISLGKNQWDFVILEGTPIDLDIGAAKLLLKPGGTILENIFSPPTYYSAFLKDGKFPERNLKVVYRKP